MTLHIENSTILKNEEKHYPKMLAMFYAMSTVEKNHVMRKMHLEILYTYTPS